MLLLTGIAHYSGSSMRIPVYVRIGVLIGFLLLYLEGKITQPVDDLLGFNDSGFTGLYAYSGTGEFNTTYLSWMLLGIAFFLGFVAGEFVALLRRKPGTKKIIIYGIISAAFMTLVVWRVTTPIVSESAPVGPQARKVEEPLPFDPEKLPQIKFRILSDDHFSQSVAFSADGKYLASGSATYKKTTITLMKVPSGEVIRVFKGHTGYLSSVAFSPDVKYLASGAYDNTVRLWDVATGEELRTFKGHTDLVNAVAFSPDGRHLASASDDKTIRFWDVDGGTQLHLLKGHTSGLYTVAFSPDGRILASGSNDSTIRLWSAATGEELGLLKGHRYLVTSIAFSPDGRYLASGSYDKTLRLWNVATRKDVRTLRGHTDSVTTVAFSPDGKILASGSYDKNIILWDVDAGEPLYLLKGHTREVLSVTLSPDGRYLASGSRTVRLWNMLMTEEESSTTLKPISMKQEED